MTGPPEIDPSSSGSAGGRQRWSAGPGMYRIGVRAAGGSELKDVVEVRHTREADWTVTVGADRWWLRPENWGVLRTWGLNSGESLIIEGGDGGLSSGYRRPVVDGPARVRVTTLRPKRNDIPQEERGLPIYQGVHLEALLTEAADPDGQILGAFHDVPPEVERSWRCLVDLLWSYGTIVSFADRGFVFVSNEETQEREFLITPRLMYELFAENDAIPTETSTYSIPGWFMDKYVEFIGSTREPYDYRSVVVERPGGDLYPMA